jgi:amino acid transporter
MASSGQITTGRHIGDRYVRITRDRDFSRAGPGHIVATAAAGAPSSTLGRVVTRTRRALFGRPLASAEEPNERLGVGTGLAVFASDNISSSAYATEEIMRVLVVAGAGALVLTMPITIGIVIVLAIVVVSYLQTIRAYPSGGGSYIVASENLGRLPGLTAAGALLTDYVLTVAVSVAAGVAALTSIAPELFDWRVAIGVGLVVLLTVGNLRGVRESAAIFSAPTYVYLLVVFGLLGFGLVRAATGTLPAYVAPEAWRQAAEAGEALGLLLLFRAFASGAVALTGTEAVSNGVPAFRPPEWRRAQLVLILMGTFFATIFLGLSFLAGQLGVLPDPTEQETVMSQVAGALLGAGSPLHYLVQLSTALILVLAANTAFADFPRLASILARDRYLPRVFQFRGDRLAFTGGIVVLATIAASLIVVFRGSVTALIPLYTVGVFLAFTLSQAGMVRHWYRLRDTEPRWRLRAAISGAGALTTGFVAVEVAASKFILGAWMVLLLIPVLIWGMSAIHHHYVRLASARRARTPTSAQDLQIRAIVPIAELDVRARQALAFARAIAPDPGQVVAVHVTDDVVDSAELRAAWSGAARGIELIVIESPYRSLTRPLMAYVDAQRERYPRETITVVLPEFVPGRWWEHLLHNQTALRLKAALLFRPGVVVVNVPYHVGRSSTPLARDMQDLGAGGTPHASS